MSTNIQTNIEVKSRKIDLIGVPLSLGVDRPGSDQGPAALREAGLAGRLQMLGHDVTGDENLKVPQLGACPRETANCRYGGAVRRICEDLFKIVHAALTAGRFPLVLGGDHSLGMGSVAGSARFVRDRGQKLGLLWMDAHGDMNTPETTESGLVHGMPLAHILGRGDEGLKSIGGFIPKVDPSRCVLVGVRDLDAREKDLVRSSGVRVFTMNEIDRKGYLLDSTCSQLWWGECGPPIVQNGHW
ncbi:MAG: arginase [Planctomycetes bacterium]|nr:arginase [Planctomycetota bacterium]